MSYLFTSSALVLRPLPGSPLHLNQNLSSKFFNSDGFLPQSDAPGISLSSRNDPLDIFDNKLERVASGLLIPWPYLPRSDAISHHSARAIRHYESRVCSEVYQDHNLRTYELFDLLENYFTIYSSKSHCI